MRFRVLGPVTVEAQGNVVPLGGPKQRAILAMLLVERGRPVSIDRIVDGVWGDAPPGAVRTSIHSYVSNLRTALGGRISQTSGSYRLETGEAEIDAVEFEALLDDGRKLLVTDAARAAKTIGRSLALWQGTPYADLIDVPGLQIEIHRLENLRLNAVEARIDAEMADGRHRAVIGELASLTAEHPLHEGFLSRRMLALYRDGRQTDALRVYERSRTMLVDELGLDPSPELRDLEHRILTHDPDLQRPADLATRHVAFLIMRTSVPAESWDARPEATRDALARFEEAARGEIVDAGGRIFRRTGEIVMAAFGDAASATRAAIGVQRSLAEIAWPADVSVGLSMAIDAGEVEVKTGEFHGPPLSRAVRFVAAAHPGQVIMTAHAQDALRSEAGVQVRNLGEHEFPGLGGRQAVYQLLADGLEAEFPDLALDDTASDLERRVGDSIRTYEIRERIGSGRSGVVYRVYQPSLGREAAVKAIRATISNHPDFIRRFEGEARMVARLEHPHIASLFDYWRDPEGAFFVMPLLAGGSLADLDPGDLTVSRAWSILRQVGAALSYSHSRSVIHRDVKPSNILLDEEGNAYLADFGIAEPISELAPEAGLARPAFRAPEDLAGSAIDDRTDVYSLGCVARLLLKAVDPRLSDDLDALDSTVRAALARATAEDPDKRFATVAEFLAALDAGAAAPPLRDAPARRNPYKGLAAFETDDADDFFGRDREVDVLSTLVAEHRYVTVVGPSGSGKSSLVKAGLIPVLRGDPRRDPPVWACVTMTPGRHPFEHLSRALDAVSTEPQSETMDEVVKGRRRLGDVAAALVGKTGEDGDLVLVIDQFEELYAQADDETRRRFIAELIDAVDTPNVPLRIVTTVRADFFDHPLSDERISARVRDALLVLGVPDARQVADAIERPAERAGLRLEPGLAQRIVADVRQQPGALPLMQFVLTDLADASPDGTIASEDYTSRGGVRRAVSRRATEIYEGFDERSRSATEQVFLRLVTVSEEADDVRRRVHLSELRGLDIERGALDEILEAYGDARLLIFDHDPTSRSPTVEVAHEALLREWPLLRTWVAQRRESLIVRRRVDEAMRDWQASGRDEQLLPSDGRLAQFAEWARDPSSTPTRDEFEFVDAARDRRDREEEARRVEAARVDGLRLTLESEKQLGLDPELACLLALESVARYKSISELPSSAVDALRRANLANRIRARFPGIEYAAISPDGCVIAVATVEGVALRDAGTLDLMQTLVVDEGEVIAIFFADDPNVLHVAIVDTGERWLAIRGWSRSESDWLTSIVIPYTEGLGKAMRLSVDGRFVVTPQDGMVVVRDRESGQVTYATESRPDTGVALASGRLAFPVAGPDGEPAMRVVDLAGGTDLDLVEGLTFWPQFMTFSPDGTRVAGVLQTGVASVLDLEQRREVWRRDDLDRAAPPLWIEGGERVVLGGEGALKVLDAHTGRTIRQIVVRGGGWWPFVELPGTGRVITAGASTGEALVLDVSDSTLGEIGAWRSPIGVPNVLNFDDTGELLFTGDLDRQHAVIDARKGTALRSVVPADPGSLPNKWGIARTSRNGRFVAGADRDGRYKVWSFAAGSEIYAAPAGWAIIGVSDDGSMAVISQDDVETRLVATSNQTTIANLDAGPSPHRADFSPDGTYLVASNVVGPSEPGLRVLRVSDGRLLSNAAGAGHDGVPHGWSTEFTPDGSKLVSGGWDGAVRVLDFDRLIGGAPDRDSVVLEIAAHSHFIIAMAISPDGSVIASSSWSEPARLWDLDTGTALGEFGTTKPTAVAFHPAKPWLYVCDGGVVSIHVLDVDELIEISRSRLIRGMTPDERSRYLLLPPD